jgi:hypothetical protein
MQIIFLIVIIVIIVSIIKKIFETIKEHIGMIILIAIGIIGLVFIPVFTIGGALIVGIILFIVHLADKHNKEKKHLAEIKNNKNWLNNNPLLFSEGEVDQYLSSLTDNIVNIEKGSNKYLYYFTHENMPFGRANAFLNTFGESVFDNEPYAFMCNRSPQDDEFQEYGYIISRKGVYFLTQTSKHIIPFSGLIDMHNKNSSLSFRYVNPNTYETESSEILISDDNIRREIFGISKYIITSGLNKSLFVGNVVNDSIINETANYYQQQFNNQNDVSHMYKNMQNVGVVSSSSNFYKTYNENKNLMGGARGNGYAAEYGNITADRLRYGYRNVENAAQDLVGGKQKLHGADRIVNSINVQTKYYQSASESIGAAFENKQAIYLNEDGTMMQIEVPRDQYIEALKLMQKRINSGQVPKLKPGQTAKDFVRKGYYTYEQSFNIAKAGSIEGIVVDVEAGIICSTGAASISALIVFAQAIWSGKSPKEAAESSLKVGFMVLGKGALVYTLTMQMTRKQIINPFDYQWNKNGTVRRGYAGIDNPIFQMSENLANKISSSSIANTNVGNALNLNKITGKVLVSSSVTAVIVFGPDVVRGIQGKISGKQFLKNSAVAGGSLVGGAVGQALIPIPVVGTMIGGAIGGFVSKRTLDKYVEDDAKEMFRILKEEFIDTTGLAGLNNAEFSAVVDATIANKKLNVILQNMYRSGEHRRYARESIMEPAIQNVLKERKIITNSFYDDSVLLLAG